MKNPQPILQAIYNRSHAQHHNLASLDQVAKDLGIHDTPLRLACQQLGRAGLVNVFARYLSLTAVGRNLVENTW